MQRSAAVLKESSVKLGNLKTAKYIDFNTAMFVTMGFLLSRSILVESVAPLGVAFFICTLKIDRYKIPVFISTLLGTILSFNSTAETIKYSICILVFMMISKKIKNVPTVTHLGFIGMFVVLSISVGQVLLSSRYLYDFLIALMEGVIVFVSVYIFYSGVDLLTNIKNRMSVKAEEAIGISLMTTFSIMGIGSIAVLGISVRTVLSTVLILVASIIGGATMGATTGVIVGLAFILNNITSAIYMGIYSFAGVVSGTFNKINKYFCILGYILSWIIIYAYTTGISSNMTEMRDILIACLIVISLPKSFFNKIEKVIKSNISSNEVVYDYIMRSKNVTNNRLVSMYKTYDDLAVTFDRIREKEKILDQRDMAHVIDMIHKDECRNCGMKRMCWETRFNHTYTMMCDILTRVESNGEISLANVPERFTKECMKPEAIVKMANCYYKMFAIDYDWNVKFSESRKLIANQIRSISRSIQSLQRDLEKNIMLDLEKEKSIQEELDRYAIHIDRVSYLTKDNNEFEITIENKSCKDGCLCENKIIDVIENFTGESISVQKVGCHSLSEKCRAVFVKAQKYKAHTEVASMSRDGHLLCGDSHTYMDINDGKYMMAISDGMGKGKRAYEESSATIEILEKMMDAKIDDEIVISTINNMLLLKSSDEMFSTLDLGIVDLKRGNLETIKMGACSTYIKRDSGEIDLVSSSSLPVGILSDVKLDRHNVKIKNGDYIIMVSDGIIDAGKNNNLGDNWLIYFLKKLETTNPNEMANAILDRALELQSNSIEDDMTALVTRIDTN